MNKNWKYLALILVFTYLVSGFAAISYAEDSIYNDVFGDVFAPKQAWDFSNAQDTGGYIDVITYSLGEKTIDFILAFGVVFSALYMGLNMISFGGGFTEDKAVKTSKGGFAVFAAMGTAFYVNMNAIPFTAFIAPYALFLTIAILALIMGNMIIKLKEGDADFNMIMMGAGMACMVGGIGMYRFLREARLHGIGAFVAFIGAVMLILGVILSLRDKYKPKPKKDEEAKKAAEEEEEEEKEEEKDESEEERDDNELYTAIYSGNFVKAYGLLIDEQNRLNDLERDLKKEFKTASKLLVSNETTEFKSLISQLLNQVVRQKKKLVNMKQKKLYVVRPFKGLGSLTEKTKWRSTETKLVGKKVGSQSLLTYLKYSRDFQLQVGYWGEQLLKNYPWLWRTRSVALAIVRRMIILDQEYDRIKTRKNQLMGRELNKDEEEVKIDDAIIARAKIVYTQLTKVWDILNAHAFPTDFRDSIKNKKIDGKDISTIMVLISDLATAKGTNKQRKDILLIFSFTRALVKHIRTELNEMHGASPYYKQVMAYLKTILLEERQIYQLINKEPEPTS